MDDEGLAARIRAAFEEIPVPGREELLAVPARTGWRRAAGFVLAVSVAIAAGGFLWLHPGGGAEPAGAWTSHPRPQDSTIIALAEQGCGPGGVNGKSLGTGPIDEGLPLNVVDARGNTAAAFFTDGTRYSLCRFSWDNDGRIVLANSVLGGFATHEPSSLDILVAAGSNDSYSLIIGHTGPGAAKVSVDLGSGDQVTASVGNGFYLAWWPDHQTVVKVSSSSNAGVVLGILDHPTPSGS